MGMPSMPELLIILTIVVLLFGAKKIPDLAKGLGKGIKDFKKAIKDDEDKEKDKVADAKEIKDESKDKVATPNTTTVAEPAKKTEETIKKV